MFSNHNDHSRESKNQTLVTDSADSLLSVYSLSSCQLALSHFIIPFCEMDLLSN